MAASTIGDTARTFVLRQQTSALKAELDRRSNEATTGLQADVGRSLRGDLTPLAGIASSLARNTAYLTAMNSAATRAEATQTALLNLSGLSTQLSTALLSVASAGSEASIATVAEEGRTTFTAALSTLATRIGDRSIFAGLNTGGSTTASADAILDALQSEVNSLTSAGSVEAAVSAWFDDPAGFAATGYLGGAPLSAVEIAPGSSVMADVTALDPAIVATLKGMAVAALLDRGVLAAKPEERAKLARSAAESLMESADDRTALSARIGIAQARIEDNQTQLQAEQATLAARHLALVSIDPYDAATALTEAKSQLETLYAVTAKVLGLKLSDYL